MPDEPKTMPPKEHPAEKARQGAIILRHTWSRIIFFGALALIVLVALLARFL
jgi:hypothetical protein